MVHMTGRRKRDTASPERAAEAVIVLHHSKLADRSYLLRGAFLHWLCEEGNGTR